MNKDFSKKYKSQKGFTGILIAMLVLFSILPISLIMNDIILNNMKMNKNRFNSTKAFFAAEAGSEQILWELRKDDFDLYGGECLKNNNDLGEICYNQNIDGIPNSCLNDCSSISGINEVELTSNNSKYSINYKYEKIGGNSTTTLFSIGKFFDVNRVVELRF